MKRDEQQVEPAAQAGVEMPTITVVCDRCRADGEAGDGAFAQIADILDFEPVPRRRNVNAWTGEHQRAFIAALAVTGSAWQAAKAVGRHHYGAEQLRTAKGGKGFDEAWDAALGIARDRELARLKASMGELSEAAEAEAAAREAEPGGGRNRRWDPDDEDRAENEYQEAQARTRDRLLRARRLLLFLISGEPDKQAAWELLVGPVDWDRAGKIEPQDNEPYGMPRMRGTDMLLTAEAGLLHDAVGAGRDLTGEIGEALDEYAATGAMDGPKMRRVCGDE